MSFNKKSRPSINMFSDLFDKYDLSFSLFSSFLFLSLFAIWTIILFPFFLFSVLECIHGRQSGISSQAENSWHKNSYHTPVKEPLEMLFAQYDPITVA